MAASPKNTDASSTSIPRLYQYDVGSDTIQNSGLIIAGNNKNGTRGVSPTTLTGRQWGIAPRLGAAWQPGFFHNKVVVRAGGGMYYDRGELFSYFSPGYAIGTVTGGPFGVNQQLPFVNVSSCPIATTTYLYYYIPTCGGTVDPETGYEVGTPSAAAGNLENPYGLSLLAPPNNPKASDLNNYLPNAASIMNFGQPISLGVYDRRNKLPYTMNYTLDFQWQPRNDLAIEFGYVGNLGRHQVIPVPFNQPVIASHDHPTLAGSPFQQSYQLRLQRGRCGARSTALRYLANYEGGNVDLRVPYIGYAAESIAYKAAGVDAYNALQSHVEKRMSHGIQVGSFLHLLARARRAERPRPLLQRQQPAQSARRLWLGRLRPHPRAQLQLRLPHPRYCRQKPLAAGKLVNGWSLVGLTVLQSGQPYSVIDFSGAIGSIFYSTANGITNPIVPLATGCTPKNALTKASGAWFPVTGVTALKPAASPSHCSPPAASMAPSLPLIPTRPASPPASATSSARPPRSRADASLVKVINLKERYYAQVHLRRLQPHQHHQLRRPRQRSLAEPVLRRVPAGRHYTLAHGLRRRWFAIQPELLQLPRRPRHRDAHHRQPSPDPDVSPLRLLVDSLTPGAPCLVRRGG